MIKLSKINEEIRIVKKIFVKKFPRLKTAIEEGNFTIKLLLWTDDDFEIELNVCRNSIVKHKEDINIKSEYWEKI